MTNLDPWLAAILADPITKLPARPDAFPQVNSVIDARVFLRNTHGYDDWTEGQTEYEQWTDRDKSGVDAYRKEIVYDRPIYEHFTMDGRILDCGGGRNSARVSSG